MVTLSVALNKLEKIYYKFSLENSSRGLENSKMGDPIIWINNVKLKTASFGIYSLRELQVETIEKLTQSQIISAQNFLAMCSPQSWVKPHRAQS